MKITIEPPLSDGEDEIVIRCNELDEELMELIYAIKNRRSSLTAYEGKNVLKLSPKDIFYFESVDNRVFAYCEKQVCEVRQKLYELEKNYERSSFLRISKSVIINVSKISSIAPMFNGRLEANLQNGEKLVISRQYVPDLKKALGIAERR